MATARTIERYFAAPYLAFALLFGAFSARAFQVASAESHVLVVGLVVGFAAGVASGVFLRPWIAVASMVSAVMPTALIALTSGGTTYVAVGLLLCTFLAGGIERMSWNFRKAATEITARRDFASLAREDPLTGLANRLSMRELFDVCRTSVGPDRLMAVHCLDLDRFKPVNDRYGHPFGDALLRAVSQRLRGLLRQGDIIARVGGDEFVIIQASMKHPGEAELLARRIIPAICEPFSIDGQEVTIGTSLGFSLFPVDGDLLDDLVHHADQALIRAKRGGGGVLPYSTITPMQADDRLCA